MAKHNLIHLMNHSDLPSPSMRYSEMSKPTPHPDSNPDFWDYDLTCRHSHMLYEHSADNLLLVKPNGVEVIPSFLNQVSIDLTVEEVDRLISVWNACRHVPSEALAPDLVCTLLGLIPNIANYLECCVETNRHDPDDSAALLESLQPFL